VLPLHATARFCSARSRSLATAATGHHPFLSCSPEPDEIADALAFALQNDGRGRVHQADSFICRIAAERLVQHLGRCGFVVMCKPPPAVAPTASQMPLPPGRTDV
jgi:hypothetical protein